MGKSTLLPILLCLNAATLWAATPPAARIAVDVNEPGARISPRLFGLFFEEIDCSGDGGLYPELVRNRSFEDSAKPDSWSLVTRPSARGTMALSEGFPAGEFNRHGLRLKILTSGAGRVGIANDGWWGMGLKAGESYQLSFYARAGADFNGPVTAWLENASPVETLVEAASENLSKEWKRYNLTLRVPKDAPRARLVLGADTAGSIAFDFVSLMPATTFKQHGLRQDLAELLAQLRPGFLRFPGGCWVEGSQMDQAQRWKTTIGEAALRRTQYNIWGYMATNGLGYHEYLQLCEDLGCPALFVFNCGMSHKDVVPIDQMGPYIQDALDAIEYANGPADSKWGSLRAKAGHPQPFDLQYVEIGNENGGAEYNERYALFYDAIKARYPKMRMVACQWKGKPTSRPLEILDEHYYFSAEWFMLHADQYDRYDRKGPKIFIGEYAVTHGSGLGNLKAALGEAAFMTGIERNGDIVELAAYAPLFANVNHKHWNPDLIYFDASRSYGIPSYHVQKMFASNRGDRVVPVTLEQPEVQTLRPCGFIGMATAGTKAEFKEISVTRDDQILWKSDFSQGTKGWRIRGGDWKVVDGALRQSDPGADMRIAIGDESWEEYTLCLKARKLEGSEGFIIGFHEKDRGRRGAQWRLGGKNNQQHQLEVYGGLDFKPGKIESNRWYDIRMELKAGRIRCFLDGQKIHDVSYPSPKPLYTVASVIENSKELVLKVVNTALEPVDAEIQLRGATKLGTTATLTQLTSENLMDENSLSEPLKVASTQRQIPIPRGRFTHTLPACSVTVLRMAAE